MTTEYREIDYEEICKHYWNIYHRINEEIDNKYPYGSEDYKKGEDEQLNVYGFLERGTWRLGELEDMYEFSDEPDFFYYAMEHLSNMRHRIQHYFEDSSFEFSQELYRDYKKYDSLVIDYYGPIRTSGWSSEKHDCFDYYYKLMYRKHHYTFTQHEIENLRKDFDKLEEYIEESIKNKTYPISLESVHEKLQELDYDLSVFIYENIESKLEETE